MKGEKDVERGGMVKSNGVWVGWAGLVGID